MRRSSAFGYGRLQSALVISLLLLGTSSVRAEVLHDIKISGIDEHRLEVGFTITGWIAANDIDALARCIPTKEHVLPQKGTAAQYFKGIRWETKRLRELDACNLQHCVFNLPRWAIRRLLEGKTTQDRLRLYYEVVRDISWRINKKRKYARIEPYLMRNEPCGKHNLFHWLLNGHPRPWDKIVWRKHFAKRMRPTLKTMQFSTWRTGPYRCIGATVLFGDHYYYDGLELLQLSPRGPGKVAFRFAVRERYDIFKEWWARRFRGTVRDRLKRRRLSVLRDRVSRCLN